MDEPFVGEVIHVSQMSIADARICNAAIVGGFVDSHMYAVILPFNGSRTSWLEDENWHHIRDCPTPTRKTTEAEVRNERLTNGEPVQ